MKMSDIFGMSPLLLILICMGVISLIAVLTKYKRARKLGLFCGLMLLVCLWIIFVNSVIMPASGIDPETSDYKILGAFLSMLPFLIYAKKIL